MQSCLRLLDSKVGTVSHGGVSAHACGQSSRGCAITVPLCLRTMCCTRNRVSVHTRRVVTKVHAYHAPSQSHCNPRRSGAPSRPLPQCTRRPAWRLHRTRVLNKASVHRRNNTHTHTHVMRNTQKRGNQMQATAVACKSVLNLHSCGDNTALFGKGRPAM